VEAVSLLIIFIVLCAVVAVVLAPLRGAGGKRLNTEAADRLAELEVRKQAKYREIRDAELDLQTGKLSEEDHRPLDRQLRAEAIEILRAIDEESGQ